MPMSSQRLSDNITVIDAPINGKTGILGTYLVTGEKNAVIDPGPTSQTRGVIDEMRKLGVKNLDWVLATHIHLDHAGGSWLLLNEYPESMLYCHPKGVAHMVEPSKLRDAAERLFGERILEYGEIRGVQESRVQASRDHEIIDLDGVTLEVYWTPGHSSHSQCYFEPDSRTAFVGDAIGHTIGDGGPVRPASPPPHNPVQALESIDLIRSLDPETLCVAHFGAYKDPEMYLERISSRTRLWMRLAEKIVDDGMRLDDLVALTMREDHELKDHIKGVEGADHSVKPSLLGFYLYAKWVKNG
ncbi:MAG: MBL fold metallo-hydrolase [Candidatus Bathyarchaeota archaeon]|nr:MBL fold metallo-hydrolase [Candidatus Bathyarchaeota archaeon]